MENGALLLIWCFLRKKSEEKLSAKIAQLAIFGPLAKTHLLHFRNSFFFLGGGGGGGK